MTAAELQNYIYDQIPLTRAMELKVTSSGESGIQFRLPLRPNRNHQNTVFGGTLLSAQALIAWAWLTTRLEETGAGAVVVIRKSESRFLAPVDEDFDVTVQPPAPGVWDAFVKDVQSGVKAKIQMHCEVLCRGRKAVTFSGEYVAIKS